MSDEIALLDALRVPESFRLQARLGRWAWIIRIGAGLAALRGQAAPAATD